MCKIIYIESHESIELEILAALNARDGNNVRIREDILVLPMVLNVSNRDAAGLSLALGKYYREFAEFAEGKKLTETGVEVVRSRVSKLVQSLKRGKVDLIVLYSEGVDISPLIEMLEKELEKNEENV